MAGGWWLAGTGREGAACAALPRTDEQQSRTTGHWPPPIHASSPSGMADGKVGEGAGRPGLARSFDCFTVSTKPDLGRPSDPPVKSRSGRDGAAPRSRFPRALRLAALASGLTGSSVADIAASDAGGTWHSQRSAPLARGEQAGAIHRPPQGPPKYPSPGLHRSTTARRHRGAGSDALPTDGMGRV